MPKRIKSQRESGRVQGPASHWPSSKRLEYHITEMAMHLQVVETIVGTEGKDVLPKGDSVELIMQRRKLMGKTVKEMYRILEINCPDVIKQSHTWKG